MHDTGCLGLVHWDDPEGWYGEGGLGLRQVLSQCRETKDDVPEARDTGGGEGPLGLETDGVCG